MPLPRPIIVVPGFPGSTLIDLYSPIPDDLWAQERQAFGFPGQVQKHERIKVHPDSLLNTLNTTGEKFQPARIAALNPLWTPYASLIEGLRKEIRGPLEPTPVFPFGYDWRVGLGHGASQLKGFIGWVLDACAQLPEYKDAPPTEVDLVGHSAGGVVIARYLRDVQRSRGKVSRVHKVVSIASPFLGAPHAAWKLTGDQKERDLARTLPTIYEVLPRFVGAVTDELGRDVDLTNLASWPSSVRDGLKEYSAFVKSKKQDDAFLSALLANAVGHWAALDSLDLGKVLPLGKKSWLPLVGFGEKTAVRVTSKSDAPWFMFPEEDNLETGQTGDATVALAGVFSRFFDPGQIVGFTDDDISTGERFSWTGLAELLNKLSLHSILPMMDAVQRVTIAFLRDSAPRATLRGRPVPGPNTSAVDWPAWLRP